MGGHNYTQQKYYINYFNQTNIHLSKLILQKL